MTRNVVVVAVNVLLLTKLLLEEIMHEKLISNQSNYAKEASARIQELCACKLLKWILLVCLFVVACISHFTSSERERPK